MQNTALKAGTSKGEIYTRAEPTKGLGSERWVRNSRTGRESSAAECGGHKLSRYVGAILAQPMETHPQQVQREKGALASKY